MRYLSLLALLLVPLYARAEQASIVSLTQTADAITVLVKMELDKEQALLQSSLSFTTDHPGYAVQQWQADQKPANVFDPLFKEHKPAYRGTTLFTVTLTPQAAVPTVTNPTMLYLHYLTTDRTEPQEQRLELKLAEPTPATETVLPKDTQSQEEGQSTEPTTPATHQSLWQLIYNLIHKLVSSISAGLIAAQKMISSLFTSSRSLGMQILLAFALGILMSFTPCIYPMIPITVGLLGTDHKHSLLRNFSLAATYTSGLATTFALLGLFTTFCGAQCGQLLSNPWFVIALVIILAYLGLSMFGWYELTIPRFLQPKSTTVKQGSYLSAFLFGLGSGTIASPCMSPGLALVLTFVASLGNLFLGFLLLFIFGLGASLPLLIIGTFSASLHIMPRAGMWMIEIKKTFGFMLLGMCLYYLKPFFPLFIFYGLLGLFLLVISGYYLLRAIRCTSAVARFFTVILTLGLLIAALFTFFTSYKSWHVEHQPTVWRVDYDQARAQAIAEHKKILLDFGASWCTSCSALETTILHDRAIEALANTIVLVKVDGSRQGSEPYTSLTQKFHILGLPTVILYDPTTDQEIKRWDSGLTANGAQAFAQELEQIA